jgi:hypothetical protein
MLFPTRNLGIGKCQRTGLRYQEDECRQMPHSGSVLGSEHR